MSTAQPQFTAAPPRSKVEMLHHEILQQTDALLTRTESLVQRQETLLKALQTLPAAIQQAGNDAGNQASVHASRSLIDAARDIDIATRDLRSTYRSASALLPAVAWKTGVMCAASALSGSLLCAIAVALLI